MLRAGERLPAGVPKRYLFGNGYVRLRWRVGTRSYVEVYEHRVDGDRVTSAPVVHHEDHRRDNNDPGNLKHLASRAEHVKIHRPAGS
jgi:hypothetical protein